MAEPPQRWQNRLGRQDTRASACAEAVDAQPSPLAIAATSAACLLALLLATLLARPAIAQPAGPAEVEASPLVARLIDDDLTPEPERQALRLFHGQWDGFEPSSPEQAAQFALYRFDLTNDALQPEAEATPPLLRAEAAIWRSQPEAALTVLNGVEGIPAAVLRAKAHEQLGATAEAIAALKPIRERLDGEELASAADLTAAADAVAMLARLEGRPSHDFHLAMGLLSKAHQQVDPLYWPARIVEARLLIDKDNRPEAAAALVEALKLNPRGAETWYWLARMSLESYNFDGAAEAVAKLREINPTHLLADLAEIRSFLQQRDVASARSTLSSATERWPTHRRLIALSAAADALDYDEPAMREHLAAYEKLSPGSAEAIYLVGTFLSVARQYPEGDAMLREAIARQPNWSAPRAELGLLLMQWGDIEAARKELALARQLDPFQLRVNNQLKLAEDLLGYKTIETDHFLIRYRDGIDAVLARDMPGPLEGIYRDITAAFDHQPAAKTQIDILPDEEHFGVRITGVPDIWTIAASTGDVIALTPPRSGAKQRGAFNWANVIRHEYVHTVTLAATENRIPHWFTEACAVSQETTGRSYGTCRLLASALQKNMLFELDQINWGFIRPRTPQDRPLAYAQADWMLEYIGITHGHQAVLDLLARYRQGEANVPAVEAVTGKPGESFMQDFRSWAAEQVASWGLDQRETPEELAKLLEPDGDLTATDEDLAAMREKHPDHPDLLRLIAERKLAAPTASIADKQRAVEAYEAVRPVDPWSNRALALLALKARQPEAAIPHMQAMDRREPDSGVWAIKLANIHRDAGRMPQAYDAAVRALHREPYNGTYRELAAATAIQAAKLDDALFHLESLSLLEPDRAIHQLRLAALLTKLGRDDEAAAAREKAEAIKAGTPE